MKLVCLFKAACKAIEQAKAQDITKLVLYTDSMSMASHLGEGLEAEWLEDQHREGGDQQGGLRGAGAAGAGHGHSVDACSWPFGI